MRPLDGLRVLELARVLAGPWAGQTLSDLGAEVIKVEAPAGDDTRHWGPPFVERGEDRTAAYFHGTNRGKSSVVADLRTKEGRTLVRDLAADADVLIENFKVGGLAKYGLDFASLSPVNPALIYCSITGFGQSGPDAARAGYDVMIQGMSGLMSITGDEDGPPTKVGVAVTDIVTGLYATIAIQAALLQRNATGHGQHIDMALFDSALALTANQAMNAMVTGRAPGRMGNRHPNLTPYETFPVQDGWLIIAVGNDGQFRKLCEVLGLGSLLSDQTLATNAGRLAARERLSHAVGQATSEWRRDELLAAFAEAGVPAGPINSVSEAMDEPQALHRGLRVEDDGVPGIRSPMRFSDAEVTPPKAAPALDADGKRVRKTGWPDADRERWSRTT